MNLHLAAMASLVWCGSVLAIQVLHAISLGLRRAHAPARGSAWRGVFYAFGPGMLPWHKDGARLHPGVFVAGVAFHLGVFAATVAFVLAANGVTLLPVPARLAVGVLALAGAVGGLFMLACRVRSIVLRRISAPDDYASNLLTTVFLACAAATAVEPAAWPTLLVSGTVLFVYAPLGKIRHCVFFPIARSLFAVSFGRRGVLGRAHVPSPVSWPPRSSSDRGCT